MGWKQALQYARGTLGAHGIAKPAERADDALPYGMRIGSLLKLQTNSFLMATINGCLVKAPDAVSIIKAISRVRLNLSGSLYRAYLSTGDVEGEAERFLQLFVNAAGVVEEATYYGTLVRIYPETREEQDAFTGASGAGLGDDTYTLTRDQLEGLGLAAGLLDVACGTAGQVDYERAAGDPGQSYQHPFEGTETRVDDAAGSHGLTQTITFMPYERALGSSGARESLLISSELVASIDGDASKREFHVDFMVGLPIEKERFTVQ